MSEIETLRDALAEDFEPRAERALARWAVTTRDDTVAGVACQVVEPAEGAVSGTVLHFFGGGYVSGKPEFDLPITAAVAALAKVRMVVPRYGLAPEHRFPVGLNQCIAVCRAVAMEGPYSLSGESAGGGMALAVAHAGFADGIRSPDAVVLYSPWGDLREEATVRCEAIDDPTLTGDDLRVAARSYLDTASPEDFRASPALAPVPQGWPDTLLTTCTCDLLGPTVRALAVRVEAAGAVCELIDLDGLCHVFEVYDEYPEGIDTLRRAAAFIAARQPVT